MHFAEEEQPVEMRAQSTDDQDVMDGLEVRAGRGSAGLVRGRGGQVSDGRDQQKRQRQRQWKQRRAWKERRTRMQRSSTEHEVGGGGKPEGREEDGRSTSGAKHGSWWLTPPGHAGLGRRRNERNTKDEMGRL